MKTDMSLNENLKNNIINEKKLKEYQYDSLVYRYIRAREQMAEYEYKIDNTKLYKTYRERTERDILKFCKILDEVMGKHD